MRINADRKIVVRGDLEVAAHHYWFPSAFIGSFPRYPRRKALLVQAAALEEGLDVGGVAGEVLEQVQGVLAAALRQQRGAEVVAVLAAQAAVLLEPLHRVRVQHL